jgi:hypothetical protein
VVGEEKFPGLISLALKDRSGKEENRQLLTTTEYSTRDDLKFPEIISVTAIMRKNQQLYRYRVRDYFRKYDSPEECFDDHSLFFFVIPDIGLH